MSGTPLTQLYLELVGIPRSINSSSRCLPHGDGYGTRWEVPMHQISIYRSNVPRNGWVIMDARYLGWNHNLCSKISAENIFSAIKNYGLYFGAAPVVLGMMLNAPPNIKSACTHKVKVMTPVPHHHHSIRAD